MSDPPIIPDPADVVRPGERAELAKVARDLINSNKGLATTATNLTKRLKHRTWAFLAVVLFDLVLSVAALYLIRQNSSLIHEQCSVASVLIETYDKTARAEAPLGPEHYDSLYRRVQASADRLECGIPPRV
jgi:hypothetical protein